MFSEKFSVPGVMGRTTAKKGSAEAEAMRAAVESFGHDWMACIYGDDGTHQEPIKLIQAQGSPQGMPMPAVVERVDRKFAALYRGADLSSMSSSSGEGTGASLQEKETDILRRDDAETIAETLEEISRMVIEWHFGNGTEPLARVELVVPVQEDTSKVIDAGMRLADKGARVSTSALMERANIPEAKDDADVLGGNVNRQATKAAKDKFESRLKSELGQEAMANSEMQEDLAQRLTAALSDDLQPLGKALAGALQTGDLPAMQAALRKISERMPEFLESEAMEDLLANEALSALLGGQEELANTGNSDGARKGWQTRRANGWTSKRAAANIDKGKANLREVLLKHADVMDAMDVPGLGPVDFRWGNSKGGIRHVVEKHGQDEAMQIPAMLFSGELVKGKSRAWVDTANSFVLLANDFNGQPSNHWVVTGYFKKEGSDVP